MHVLMLAYHFPPVGGAGAQRMIQLARRLPAAGWEQTVITGPGSPDSRWRPRDDDIELDFDSINVRRLPGPEPPHDVAWEGRLERWLRLPSRWRRWWEAHVLPLAEDLAGDVDLVHASLAPYSTAESAVAVARRLGKPLLLDLEDPWALDEMMVYPSRLHRALELRRMRRILDQADAIVMNTAEARLRALAAFPELSPERVVTIPNAFDPLDFDTVRRREPDGGLFRIVHTGSLHTEMGMKQRSATRLRRLIGGTIAGVDFLARSHVYLLEAVEILVQRDPSLVGAVEVHLAGVFTETDRNVAARHSVAQLHEFMSHRETVELLQSADLLYLPMHGMPEGARASIVPQKTYEYIAARRPILAAVPPGDARNLLEASGVAYICRPGDVEAMTAALATAAERWREGSVAVQPRSDIVARCSSGRLAGDFTALYGALARQS